MLAAQLSLVVGKKSGLYRGCCPEAPRRF